MNNHTREQVVIDLKSNPLVSQFFAGWTPQKAISFAQNLLIIGIGVAYKLLVHNSPEEAFSKLNKMAQNVTLQYQNHSNKQGSPPGRVTSDEQAQQFRSENISRKKQFEQNQLKHQHQFNESELQDDKHKQKLKNEINHVKRQLDALNSRLDSQNHSPQQYYHSASPDFVDEQYQEDSGATQRGRLGKNKKQNQRITPKITESPPPPQSIVRRLNSPSAPKPHLNDNAIKECMTREDPEESSYPGNINSNSNNNNNLPKRGAYAQYSNNQPYITSNNQFMRSSGMNNEYEMNSSKGMQQQQIKSPERLSDAYFSTGSNFRKPSKQNKTKSKDRQLKKNNHNLGASPQQKNPSQQLGNARSDKKRPQYLQSVESRIKDKVQAHRDLYQTNPEQQQQQQNQQDNENFEDFKYMMNENTNNPSQSEREDNEKLEDEVQGSQDGNQNKEDEKAVEMGVHFSKTAQKKYYEKLEKEKQKEQQKEDERKNYFVYQQQQAQQQQQMQNYSIQYNPQQQQQFYRSMTAAAGVGASGYSSLSPPSHQKASSSQQQPFYPGQQNNGVISSDSNRLMANSNQDNFGSGPITSQKNTIYGGNLNNPNAASGGGNKKNMYENMQSFLSSPYMQQFINDDYDEPNQYNNEMEQKEDVREYDDFQYPQASPMNGANQPYLNQSHPMRQSYLNTNNPYTNSIQMDPWRQSAGSKVGFSQNPNSSQSNTQNNFYNQSIESTFGGQVPNQSTQQLPSFNPSVEQYYPNSPEIISGNTASFRQQQKMSYRNPQNIKSSSIQQQQQQQQLQQQQQQPQANTQKSLKFSRVNKQNGNSSNRHGNYQNQNAQPAGLIGEDNTENENMSDFEPRQSTFITTQYKYDSGQKNNSFAWGQQNPNKYPAFKNEELFRESINNNSDFIMPGEEVQQYLKDLHPFNQK